MRALRDARSREPVIGLSRRRKRIPTAVHDWPVSRGRHEGASANRRSSRAAARACEAWSREIILAKDSGSSGGTIIA